MLLFVGILGNSLQAQNIVTNGTFDVNTPAPASSFICDVAPWAWQASVSSSYAPLTGTQWEWRWHTSWWIDISDCGYGNGRWIKQDVPTVPGQSYIVGLDILSNAWYTAGADVYLDGALVAHFDNLNDGNPNHLDWERFEFCWVATNSVTELKIIGNAPTGSACPVIGIDDVSMIPGTDFDFEITLSDQCVPATIGYNTATQGTPTWYFNGGFLSTGPTTIVATQPGTYTIEYVTACGTVTKDTFVIECCKPQKDVRDFCLGQPTNFDFWFSDYCLEQGCLDNFTIDFGDGNTNSAPIGSPVSFSHTYGAIGPYTVQICWDNICDGTTYCDTFTVNIIDCDTCEPEVEIYEFCEGEPTYFDFLFPDDCFNADCLGELTIDFGDNTSDVANPPGPWSFQHTYVAGTYWVEYCWTNSCTGEQKCKKVQIVIKKCGCTPEASIYQFCLGQPTHFDFLFDRECEKCIERVELRTDGQFFVSGPPFNFAYIYPAPGFYSVEYCWYNRCTKQKTCKKITIEIIDCEGGEPCLMNADFNFTLCNPVHFNSTSVSNYPIIDYQWDFGDGTFGSGPNQIHHFPVVPGDYYVCLTITVQKPNGELCETTICKWIHVEPCVPSDGGDEPTDPDQPEEPILEKTIKSSLALFPNPAQSKVSVQGFTPQMKVNRVLILGIDGRQLQEIAVEKGADNVEISLDKLNPGTYLIRVEGANAPVHLKLVKE